MKTNLLKSMMVLLTCTISLSTLWAQSPEKMSYQAVIRDASDNLVTDNQVGMQISILQGSASGTAVYVETQEPNTNANGLVSIEIGTGATSDDFSAIDWANGPYFIKTETDPTGGTTYTITGTNQLLSVPYAMHAKTADSVSGTIGETDPVFGSSIASGITGTDTTNWNNKLDSYTETDPEFVAWDKNYADLINTPDLSDTVNYLTNETDPVYGSSVASGITVSDTTNWNNKLDSYTEIDPIFIASPASDILNTDITNWNTAFVWGNHAIEGYLTSYTEIDPRVPTGTQTGEMQYWNGSEWITVAAGDEGQVLTFTGGVPTWKTQLEEGEVENPITGKIWMDKNLGASQVATSSTDTAAYGDLYQWGRGTDGHQIRTSGTTAIKATTAVPNGGNSWDGLFITEAFSPYDWLTPQDNNLWQGVSGTNNPCSSGYRLPTEAEWDAERTSWSSNNSAGAFGSPLKLPVAGYRISSNGSLDGVGSYGRYWSSTVDGTFTRYRDFGSSSSYMDSYCRAYGFSVRCIKD